MQEALTTKETGKETLKMVLEHGIQKMENTIKANGSATKEMDLAFIKRMAIILLNGIKTIKRLFNLR